MTMLATIKKTKPMNKISVKITYKGGGLTWINKSDIDNLQKVVKENYIGNIRPNGGPQAGGCFDTIVEILLDISFIDFFKIVRDGLIFDLVTRGKESFVLRPLFAAFSKLEKDNDAWDYTKVRFLFEDTEVVIYGTSNLFTSKIGTVLNALSIHYNNLIDKELGLPYQLLIPIRKDINEEGQETFVNYGGGDDFEIEDYSRFWGIIYSYGFESKIYDVEKFKLLNESWTKY